MTLATCPRVAEGSTSRRRVQYARDARWGQFGAARPPGSMAVRCGICGTLCETQVSKAAHLRRTHEAEVWEISLPSGAIVYEWQRP